MVWSQRLGAFILFTELLAAVLWGSSPDKMTMYILMLFVGGWLYVAPLKED